MKKIRICPKCKAAKGWELENIINNRVKCGNCGYVVSWSEWKKLETVEVEE